MDDDQTVGHPTYIIASESDAPAAGFLEKSKRDVNRGWRVFWQRRGIDPCSVGAETEFNGGKKRGRLRTSEADFS